MFKAERDSYFNRVMELYKNTNMTKWERDIIVLASVYTKRTEKLVEKYRNNKINIKRYINEKDIIIKNMSTDFKEYLDILFEKVTEIMMRIISILEGEIKNV